MYANRKIQPVDLENMQGWVFFIVRVDKRLTEQYSEL